MPAGRPTEYRPEYGERMIALMGEGYSLTAAAADLGFHRGTIYEWAEKHPEFGNAIKIARGKRVQALERRLLREDMPGPAMTGTIFALKNADAEEWREKVVNENVGPNGGPQQHVVKHDLSDVEAARRVAFMLAQAAMKMAED